MKKKVFLLFASLVVAVVGIEVVARVAFDHPQLYTSMRYDPDVGFRWPANLEIKRADRHGRFTYRTNELGFRGPPIPSEPRAQNDGKARFLFVGDSFMNAYAVRDRNLMMNQTARIVGERTGAKTESFCISGDGLGPSQEFIFVQRHAPALRPDAIVLAVYPDNDVGTSTPQLYGYAGDYLRPYILPHDGSLRTTYRFPARAWFRRTSRAFALVEHRLVTRGTWPMGGPESQPNREFPRLREGKPATWRLEVYDPRSAGSPAWSEGWSALTRLLTEFRQYAEAMNARFLVLVIPSLRQVALNPSSLMEDTKSRSASRQGLDEMLDLNLPERRIGQHCREHGIDVRLLAGPLRANTGVARLPLYVRDSHFSGDGHRIAAEAVAAWWLREPDELGCDLETVLAGQPVLTMPPPRTHPNRVELGPSGAAYLDHAWASTSPDCLGQGPGAVFKGKLAAVAVPARPGHLLVRGSLPESAPLPMRVSLDVAYLRRGSTVLRKHGPFTVGAPNPLPPRLRPPDYDGYVAVSIACDKTMTSFGMQVGPVIHSAEFAVPGVEAHGRATACDGVLWGVKPLKAGRAFEVQGAGAPPDTDGVLIASALPALAPADGAPATYVNTGAIFASVRVKSDERGRIAAALEVPESFTADGVVVQALFAGSDEQRFCATHALVVRPPRR